MLTAVAIRHFFAVMLAISTLSQAAQGAELRGRVGMEGSILNSACSIETPQEDQLVIMKTVPVGQILRDGQGEATSLRILLIGCEALTEGNQFRVTFYGAQGSKNTFFLSGNSEGIGMRIVDALGNEVQPGVPMKAALQGTRTNTLDYTLTLKGNGEILQPGIYQTTLRMKLEYY
ncbi:fimbrial protein [Enterobacter asburiae]|nr:fimbrial protein [Enterobacter asburiae]MDE4066929.1 fimbrial protein [Enterobacter asburiae]MDE4070719.1 fimbrial protein [Enterobacter asburiae]